MAQKWEYFKFIETELKSFQQKEKERLNAAPDIESDIKNIIFKLESLETKCKELRNDITKLEEKIYPKTGLSFWSYVGFEKSIYNSFYDLLNKIKSKYSEFDVTCMDMNENGLYSEVRIMHQKRAKA